MPNLQTIQAAWTTYVIYIYVKHADLRLKFRTGTKKIFLIENLLKIYSTLSAQISEIFPSSQINHTFHARDQSCKRWLKIYKNWDVQIIVNNLSEFHFPWMLIITQKNERMETLENI